MVLFLDETRQVLRAVFQPDKNRETGRHDLSGKFVVDAVAEAAQGGHNGSKHAHAAVLLFLLRAEHMKEALAPKRHPGGDAHKIFSRQAPVVRIPVRRLRACNPVRLRNARFRNFHAVMHVRVLLIAIRSHKPVRAHTLDTQTEAAAGPGTLFNHGQMHELAGLDKASDGHILKQRKGNLLTVVRLTFPLVPEPSGPLLNILRLFFRDAEALPRDTGLRLKACTADICCQGINGRLSRAVIGVQVLDATIERSAFCRTFAADERSAGAPVEKRTAERACIPRGRRNLMRLLDGCRTGFRAEEAEEIQLHLFHPLGNRHCTSTGPCPRSNASSSLV